MDKYTFPNGAPDVLDVKLTYYEFLDIFSDAWLEAEQLEGTPKSDFRHALSYLMDKKVAALKGTKS